MKQNIRPSFLNAVTLILLLSLTILPLQAAQKVTKTNFKIQRGVNIGIWLSQTNVRGAQRARSFTAPEVKQLRQWGFDFIRLPVDEVQLFKENGTIDEETLQIVENVLSWAKTYQMKVILDLHILRSHHFNASKKPLFTSPDEQTRLCNLWTTLTKRLNRYSTELLAFELLNEPVADTNEQWNNVAQQVISAIRRINKKRILVVASNKWDNAANIPDVFLPDNDPNIMLTFHFYEPMLITHYTASWTDIGKIRVQHINYPGKILSDEDFNKLNSAEKETIKWYVNKEYNKEWMRSRWKVAIDFAQSKGLTLLLGEFGCLPAVDTNSRLNWIGDVVDLCNEYNIPRAYWEYKSGFGFCNWNDGSLKDEALMKTLVR